MEGVFPARAGMIRLLLQTAWLRRGLGVFPARAGMIRDRPTAAARSGPGRVPRSRGDDPVDVRAKIHAVRIGRCSPLARG